MSYRKLILLGFLMVLFGFIVPLLMVIQVIEPSFFWGFLSYGVSVAGLFLGLIGGSQYVRSNRKTDDETKKIYQLRKR